jgi:hypothetical protein
MNRSTKVSYIERQVAIVKVLDYLHYPSLKARFIVAIWPRTLIISVAVYVHHDVLSEFWNKSMARVSVLAYESADICHSRGLALNN